MKLVSATRVAKAFSSFKSKEFHEYPFFNKPTSAISITDLSGITHIPRSGMFLL